MHATQTAQVTFKNTPVKLIGQPNSYLKRPGFGMVQQVLLRVGMVPQCV